MFHVKHSKSELTTKIPIYRHFWLVYRDLFFSLDGVILIHNQDQLDDFPTGYLQHKLPATAHSPSSGCLEPASAAGLVKMG
jgi:hypothetical protein